MEHWAFLRNLAGLAVGLGLGLVLIPRYGALGAAWSMVASYSFVAFAVEWCAPHLRRNARLKARAFGALFSPRGYGALLARMGLPDARQ
jgi:O-antigen/teichoic acid export membrane protein